MANFHVVPKGDALHHETHGGGCPCTVEIKMIPSEKSGEFDVWYYHRVVTISEAVDLETSQVGKVA